MIIIIFLLILASIFGVVYNDTSIDNYDLFTEKYDVYQILK